MSAIFGLFQRNQKPASSSDIESMSQALAHRGKDGSGVWINGAVGLGHQMLWITPESLTEKLPYYNSDSKLAITADARIDNRHELFSKLSIPKNEQKTISDSELILLAYDKWDEQCVEHLVGDYVFAIWDDKNKKIFCATDPMGMRPVYYYLDDNLFAFASEIKALLTLSDVPKKLNEEQFARYLTIELSLQEREQTCFENISLLTSGKTLTVERKKSRFTIYGQPDFTKKLALNSETEYLEAFREIFDEAVHCRMRSAYPVTCLLSGGLDSSSIACVAAKKLQQTDSQLIGLSRILPEDYKGSAQDESYYINQVRDRWKINVHYLTLQKCGAYDHLKEECRRTEQPHVDSRHYQYREFQKTATQYGARVLLEGYGGETSASSHGHGYLAELALHGRWLQLASELTARSKIEKRSPFSLIYSQILRPLTPSWLEIFHYRLKHGNKISIANSPIHPEFALKINFEEQIRSAYRLFSTYPSLRNNERRAFELDRGETPRLFNPSESIMLYPFLDRRLIEFCLMLPSNLKVKNGWKRYLIRAGMEDRLPSEIQWRTSKQPFSPDHPAKVKAAADRASEILSDISHDDAIRHFIDVPRITRFLQDMKQQTTLSSKDVYTLAGKASIVQRGIYAIVFSKAFSELF